jgi:rare lipoprotein A
MGPTRLDNRTFTHSRRRIAGLLMAAVCVFAVPGQQARADGDSVADVASAVGRGFVTVVEEGLVSWYGAAFHSRPTASGERFDSGELTMAHPSLPFGTRVKVTNLRNGRSVVVRVNDRGPFVGTRIADLSHAAADQIGMIRRGIVRARIEVLGEPSPASAP